MPVANLATADLSAFISQGADPNALWLFLHIPKTAGSSLSAELRAICSPYRNIFLTQADYAGNMTNRERSQLMDARVRKAIDDDRTIRFRSMSGHISAGQAEQIRAHIDRTRIFTFLREPVSRVVSDYRYQRSETHPPHLTFQTRFPTLASYTGAETDRMFKQMSLRSDEPVDELIDRVSESYSFVGIVEMYPFSFNVLTRLFGDNRMPSRRERVAQPATDPTMSLTQAIRDEIADKNERDLRIYAHFKALLIRHRHDWRSAVAAERTAADTRVLQ